MPLIVEERGTPTATALWDGADRVATVRLTHVEAHAAVTQAARLGRLTRAQRARARSNLTELLENLDWLEVDPDLMSAASGLAEEHALRAYDAVHLAAAERLATDEVVLAAGDRAMLSAARDRGLSTASIG